MRINLDKMRELPPGALRDETIEEFERASEAANDPIYLSDLIAAFNLSEPVLRKLREDGTRKYIIQVMRTEWGDKPMPGAHLIRRKKRPLIRDGKPIPVSELNQWKDWGVYDKKRYIDDKHEIDSKGCILVNCDDAEYFLQQFGVHGITNRRLTQHTQEHSTEPVDCPLGGKRHVWYWRYRELSKDEYKALPVIQMSTPEDVKGSNKQR